jgi:prenyltransferase beta subunit
MEFTKKNIINSLHSIVNKDGGISGMQGNDSDPLTTAQFIVLCHKISDLKAEFKSTIDRAYNYLLASQSEDGHWERQNDTWHTSITSWSLRALLCDDSFINDKGYINGLNWLLNRQDKSGGFYEAENIETMNTYSTSTACYVLNTIHHKLELDRALSWLSSVQQNDGGFKDYCAIQKESEPSLSSYVVHGIENTNSPIADEIRKFVIEYLKGSQRISGAWSAWYEDIDSIEGTVASLKALKYNQNSQSFMKGLNFLKKELPIKSIDNWELISLSELYALAS